MSELDDFARDLRAAVDEAMPVRHVGGQATLDVVKRRARTRAVRRAITTTACIAALVGVGLVGVARLDVHELMPASSAVSPLPYEGGLVTTEWYMEATEYVVSCPVTVESDPSPTQDPVEVRTGVREDPPTLAPTAEYPQPCARDVNLARAERAMEIQGRLVELGRERAFTEFVQCMASDDVAVTVTESDTLGTVMAKAEDAVAAGSDEDAVDKCVDGYTPYLYG
jgi:hypothetical protein